jgi:hypothetical protein
MSAVFDLLRDLRRNSQFLERPVGFLAQNDS